MKAYFSTFYKIKFFLNEFDGVDLTSIRVFQENQPLEISVINKRKDLCEIILKDPIDIKKKTYLYLKENKVEVSYSYLFKTKEFEEKYFYDGFLGCRIINDKTEFRVWSPVAKSISLLIYKTKDPLIYEKPLVYQMEEKNGLFSILIDKNLKGYFYNYQVEVYDKVYEVVDPYAKAVGINGLRGAIIDFNDTNPLNWDKDKPVNLKRYVDAIIYEINIRDISLGDNSGIKDKGKFLGLVEENTFSEKGVKTGLEHIKELGVTHVQIMPFYDFHYESVDEREPFKKYNWGYDPQNYNAVEGSFSKDPYDPISRIKELKTMIKKFHDNNIGVIMDVVYNHVYDYKQSSFEKLFPGYYFRSDKFGNISNGSGCGNDIATENKMVRRFIKDSVLHWAKEYHIDGFRFDLLGLFDIDTINEIYDELKKINENIIVYGEGWDLNTFLESDKRVIQKNAYKVLNIGFFNDTIRDAVRGNTFDAEKKGFAGGEDREYDIKRSVVACTNYSEDLKGPYVSPNQSINYVSCHDNHTLWDKISITNKEDSIEDRVRIHKLSYAILLTSQGVPFLHLGCDFCRTKQGYENSYNLPDNINSIDWNRKYEFRDVFEYVKGLITLRKEHIAFRLDSVEDVKKYLKFIDSPKRTIAFKIECPADSWREIIVVYNANKNPIDLNLQNGVWNVVVDGRLAGVDTLYKIYGDKVRVSSISCMVMYRN
ncbi:pullulanase [Caloramator fervidus]|mgnify:CR=1 FL=1|uniref:Pullulanase n=1 Tax=Caloramator fervidus TaxID=29344 RepID=A0A1H5TP56_9CLOT|nr:type I pullulanase [Caloramator fervidus]SEF63807.1 pullulanase [Caloramator fervidus]